VSVQGVTISIPGNERVSRIAELVHIDETPCVVGVKDGKRTKFKDNSFFWPILIDLTIPYPYFSSAVIKEIERRNPDIITIQEVNRAFARAIEARFAEIYPCRILKPADGSWGMGTLAKNPCIERTMYRWEVG
jgi:hypothetical protein